MSAKHKLVVKPLHQNTIKPSDINFKKNDSNSNEKDNNDQKDESSKVIESEKDVKEMHENDQNIKTHSKDTSQNNIKTKKNISVRQPVVKQSKKMNMRSLIAGAYSRRK